MVLAVVFSQDLPQGQTIWWPPLRRSRRYVSGWEAAALYPPAGTCPPGIREIATSQAGCWLRAERARPGLPAAVGPPPSAPPPHAPHNSCWKLPTPPPPSPGSVHVSSECGERSPYPTVSRLEFQPKGYNDISVPDKKKPKSRHFSET